MSTANTFIWWVGAIVCALGVLGAAGIGVGLLRALPRWAWFAYKEAGGRPTNRRELVKRMANRVPPWESASKGEAQ